MLQTSICLKKATLSDITIFASIKASAYLDDRKKTKPPADAIPSWYDGDWYIGLGKINLPECKRLIEHYSCYLILYGQQSIGIFWLHQEEGGVWLEDLCILPEYQGKGFGTIALSMIETLIDTKDYLSLSTPSFCLRNRHLYEKAGYKQVGTCSNDSVILYRKQL